MSPPLHSADHSDAKPPEPPRRERHQGPPVPPSAYEDIPGLPPFEPDSVEYEPGGLQLVWYWFRDLFRRRSHDRAA